MSQKRRCGCPCPDTGHEHGCPHVVGGEFDRWYFSQPHANQQKYIVGLMPPTTMPVPKQTYTYKRIGTLNKQPIYVRI